MEASSTTEDLLKLESCTQTVEARFAENVLLLIADKSVATFV